MDEIYLDNIDEYVNDQNKIVTYKWLSLTLGVHVNTAKQMLYHYVEQRRKERSGNTLHATYLVSGKCLENGNMCHKVSVVREEKLEDVKSKLDVTISAHVYSVHKAELKDSAPLYSTDYDAMKENLKNCNKYSAIRCATAVPMSTAALQKAQEKVKSTSSDKEANKPAANNHTAPTSKPTTKQPKGIMGMFSSKSAPKSKEQSQEVKVEHTDEPSAAEGSKTTMSSKTSTMKNFFGKSAEKKVDKPEKNIKEKADGGPTSSAAGSTKPSSPNRKQDIKEELQKVAEVINDDSKDTRSKTKRLEHSDSEGEAMSQRKKRRRIKKPQPDSSDDEVIPDSPPAPEPPTSPEKHVKKEPASQSLEGRRRKRRRVLKSRTFVDEEGCIVTEKGYESESYSENEDDYKAATQASVDSHSLKQPVSRIDKEKKVKDKSQKKVSASANKGTKQASITGFFQKK